MRFSIIVILVLFGVCFGRSAGAATYVVTSSEDSGPGSLRQAIESANATPEADVIEVQATAPITVLNRLPNLAGRLEVRGRGAGLTTIQASAGVFAFAPEADVRIADLALRGGIQSLVTLSTNASVVIERCILADLQAASSQAQNWALATNAGNLVILDTLFENNQPGSGDLGGGLRAIDDAVVRIERSAFVGNRGIGGSALSVSGTAQVTLRNSTISGNVTHQVPGAAPAAAVVAFLGTQEGKQGSLLIEGSTMTENVNENPLIGAGGLYAAARGAPVLRSTIVAQNHHDTSPDVGNIPDGDDEDDLPDGRIVSWGHNLIGQVAIAQVIQHDTDLLGSAPGIDAGLGPLADHGGFTPSHALGVDSVALDRGALLSGVLTDQRGKPRVVDLSIVGNSPGGAGSDIGAYELDPVLALVGDPVVLDPTPVGVASAVAAIGLEADRIVAPVTCWIAAPFSLATSESGPFLPEATWLNDVDGSLSTTVYVRYTAPDETPRTAPIACNVTGASPAFLDVTGVARVPSVLVPGDGLLFAAEEGKPLPPKSYVLRGVGLVAPVEIAVAAPFEVSLSETAGFSDQLETPAPNADGDLGPLEVFVRYLPEAGQAHVGQIAHQSSGAVTGFVAVAGTSLSAPSSGMGGLGAAGGTGESGGMGGLGGAGPTGGSASADGPATGADGSDVSSDAGCACSTRGARSRAGAFGWGAWGLALLVIGRRVARSDSSFARLPSDQ